MARSKLAVKHERRDDAHGDRAERAAERDHEVEARQVARRGLERHELAVAEHAREEESGAEHAELQRQLVRQLRVGERPGHDAQCRGEHRQEELAPIPAPAVEAEDEAHEIERQRHDPEQRDGRDVLRDVDWSPRAAAPSSSRPARTRAAAAETGGGRAVARLRPSDSAAGGIPSATARCARFSTRSTAHSPTKARSPRTSPTPASAWRPTARAGTDSPAAPASTQDSTARTADRDCVRGSARANHAWMSGLVVDRTK